MDLDLFEKYWIGQFSGLLNSEGNSAGTKDSAVANSLEAHLRAELEKARTKPEIG